jgi:tetratricopeptide (TPR) repeat protein
MADTSHGPALLRIVIGFAIGAAIGFTIANSMISRPAPAAPPPRVAAGSAEPSTESPEEVEQLSPEDLRRAMAAVDARPTDFEAQFNMGEALLRISRRPADAVRYYERAVKLRPKDAEALVGLGDANFAAALDAGAVAGAGNRLDAARAAYERALVITPNSAGVHAALGSTYAMRKPPNVDKARASFGRALAIDPQNALARRGLADLGEPAAN